MWPARGVAAEMVEVAGLRRVQCEMWRNRTSCEPCPEAWAAWGRRFPAEAGQAGGGQHGEDVEGESSEVPVRGAIETRHG